MAAVVGDRLDDVRALRRAPADIAAEDVRECVVVLEAHVVGDESNATKRPSAEIEAADGAAVGARQVAVAHECRRVRPGCRARRRPRRCRVARCERLLASGLNATKRPSAEIERGRRGRCRWRRAGVPLTSVVVAAWVSCTKKLLAASLSPGLRLSAFESKATKRPSAEIEGSKELPSAPAPLSGGDAHERVVFAWVSRTKTLRGGVVVAGAEVVGVRLERHEAPVGGDRGVEGVVVGAGDVVG